MTHPQDPGQQADQLQPQPVRDDELIDDSLVEEISIDGMCGVY